MKKILIFFLVIVSISVAQEVQNTWKLSGANLSPIISSNLNPFGSQLGNLGATNTRWNFAYLDTTTTNHLNNTTWTLNSIAVTATGTQFNYLSGATGTTGTTTSNLVFSTSPTFITPTLGAALATSIKGNGIVFGTNTSDASDNSYLGVSGGGSDGSSRGGYIYLSGNERNGFEGQLEFGAGAGANPNNAIIKMTLNGSDVVRIINNRSFVWLSGTGASTTDSSLVISHSLGSPLLSWYGTDGDVWNLGINSSDQAIFTGASGGYSFDGQLAGITYGSDGTVSDAELLYINTLSSNAQTQINAKAPSTSPTFATSITGNYLTASEILITDVSKNIVSAPVATYPSLTELTYVKGVTSSVQPQINSKAPIANPVFTGTVKRSVTATITASTTQTQGQGALITDVNEVSVVTNVNDVVTLPSAVAGMEIFIINNGANILQIFPASGDNLGAGLNASTTLASAGNVTFVSYNDTNWEIK